jgi:HK97 family phage major capsid protein
MTKLEKQQELAKLSDKLSTLKKARELSNRPYSPEERTEIKTCLGRKEALEAELAQDEEDEANDAKINSLATDLAKSGGRKTQPDSLSTETRIESVPPPKFKTLGEQLQAIASAGMIGDNAGSRDSRLVWDNLTAASGSAQASVPSDGGYLIQKDFTTELLSKVNDTAYLKNGFQDVFKGIRMIPIGEGFDGLNAPTIDETSRATGSRWGGVQMYWGAENDTASAKKPKLRFMQMELIDLIGLAYASNRLLRDASAMQSIFMQAFTEETTFMLEDGFINGTGAGQPLGMLNSPALVSVSKETGQGAATIYKENIDKMWSRMWGRSRANAVWLINQDVEPQLANLNQSVGVGGVPVYMPAGGLSDAPFGRLKGRPVVPVEYCATVGTVGDIILADMQQIIGIDKDQMASDSSIHVRFLTNETTFRFIYRFNAQPIWNSALTPFKGSNTLSPFVALATRA